MQNKSYILFLICFFLLISLSSCSSKAGYIAPRQQDGKVILNTESLEEMTPVFYSVDLENVRVDFFIVKVDGAIESYMDACKNCYRHKKGYKIDDDEVICIHCGNRYGLDTLKASRTSCYPLPLKGKMEGGMYVIALTDIVDAGRFF